MPSTGIQAPAPSASATHSSGSAVATTFFGTPIDTSMTIDFRFSVLAGPPGGSTLFATVTFGLAFFGVLNVSTAVVSITPDPPMSHFGTSAVNVTLTGLTFQVLMQNASTSPQIVTLRCTVTVTNKKQN